MPVKFALGAKENKVLRQFLSLPIILGALLIATGLTGIFAAKESTKFLSKLNDTALGPTLAFDEISADLNQLSQNYIRLNKTDANLEGRSQLEKKLNTGIVKITRKLERQLAASKGLAYANYLEKWSLEWADLSGTLSAQLKSNGPANFNEMDAKISGLIENMSNINDFIQSDVKDVLAQSTAFSSKAALALIAILTVGLLIGLVFSFVIVKSIQKLFLIIVESKANMQNLLDNLDQGFLVFDKTASVQPEVSKAAKTFFGRDLVGQSIMEAIPLPIKGKTSFKSWHQLIFGGSLSFEALLPLAPKNFEYDNRYIELDFRPIFAEGGTRQLKKVICIASNKTEERNLRQKAESEALLVNLAMIILADRGSFVDFVLDSRRTFTLLANELRSRSPSRDTLFRGLHTIKGSCASFHMTKISDQAHDLENQLTDITALTPNQLNLHAESIKEGLAALNARFESFLKENENILGKIEETTGRTKVLPMPVITRQCQLIEQEIGRESKVFSNYIENFIQENVGQLFQRYIGVIHGIAERQLKQVIAEVVPSTIRVYAEPYGALVASYIHVFRNSLAHGIEDEEERIASGKSKYGLIRIQFAVFRANDIEMLRIEVQDDGRGIDPEQVRARAIELGVITPEASQQISATDALQLVFAAGLSTEREVTSLSGRGVGLDAVHFEAQALGGTARLESAKSKGTTVIVEVPYYKSIISVVASAKASTARLSA